MDSKKITTLVKTHFHAPKTRFSATSKNLLYDIISQMGLAMNSWKQCETYTETEDHTVIKGEHYNLIIPEIKSVLEQVPMVGKQYSFVIGSRKFVIHLVHPSHNRNPKKIFQWLDACIHKIYIWLYVADYYSVKECSPLLNIYIYFTDQKKKLGSGDIDKHNVNTAFTFSCATYSNEINIFRKEEWFKVLIHECFHSFGLDFSSMQQEVIENNMHTLFRGVKVPEFRVYETYCEMWAQLINIIFTCVTEYTAENPLQLNNRILLRMIESRVHTETLFSLFQCAKIIEFTPGIQTYTDLYLGDSLYSENTQVFSYYILKSICMFYCNDFIEWCAENNGGITFKQTPQNLLKFFQFIKYRYNSAKYLSVLKPVEEWIRNNRGVRTVEMTTMRMSITE